MPSTHSNSKKNVFEKWQGVVGIFIETIQNVAMQACPGIDHM